MPRKMYKNAEDLPQLEVPGPGKPRSAKEEALARMAETKRNVQGQKARMQEELKRRRELDEAEARAHELEPQFEAAVDEVVLADDRLRAEPTIENAQDLEEKREKANALNIMIEETLPEGRLRKKSKATADSEARQAEHVANVAELVDLAKKDTSAPRKRAKKEEPKEEISAYPEVSKGVSELMEIEDQRMAEEKEFPQRKRAKELQKQASAMEKAMEVQMLEAEKADNQKRMIEMGGVWGGESYFLLSERNEEIDAELGKLQGRKQEKKMPKVEEPLPATEEALVMGELTPEDRVADARKTIEFMNGYEREISARQKEIQAELARHGIKSASQIDAELANMSPELRAKSTGIKPDMWYNVRRMARNLMGIERKPEVKGLLEKYVELESEMNGQLHKRREAEQELEAAHAAAGRPRGRLRISKAMLRSASRGPGSSNELKGGGADMTGFLKTFTEIPSTEAGRAHYGQDLEALQHIEQGSLQRELAAVRALRMLEEDIQDSMQNLALKKDEMTLEDAQMYKDRLAELQARVSNLDNEAGKSKEATAAAKNTEQTLAQYRRMVTAAMAELQRGVSASGKGEARPMSVIGRRAGNEGQFASTSARNVVQLSKMETPDTKERKAKESEAGKAVERVNREVQVYRSLKWRKDLIDTVNTNENVRVAMHAVYEAYKKRITDLQIEGKVDLQDLYKSPDPALDYALDLYRLYARKANGKHEFSEKICQDASEGINKHDKLLGMWDEGRTTDRLVSALLSGLPKVMVDANYQSEAANYKEKAPEEIELTEADLEEINQAPAANEAPAEPIPLTKLKPYKPKVEAPLPHVNRAMSERELEAVEEESAEAEVPSEFMPVSEVAERLQAADRAILEAAKKIIGTRSNKPQNIADQYGVLVRQAEDGLASAAQRIEKLKTLLENGIEQPAAPAQESAPAEVPSEPAVEQKQEVEAPREQYEHVREVWDALNNEFRQTFGIQNRNPEKYGSIIEQNNLSASNDGGAVRRHIDELKTLVEALPEGDQARILGLAGVEMFQGLAEKYLHVPVVEKRTIRRRMRWEPESVEQKSQPEGKLVPLTEMERAYLQESLNRKILTLGKKWEQIGPRVKGILFSSKRGWIEEYARLYEEVRSGKLDNERTEVNRSLLNEVNGLLGIERPLDLVIPPSPELREKVSAAAQSAEERAAGSQRAAPPEEGGQVVELSRIREERAKKNKKKA